MGKLSQETPPPREGEPIGASTWHFLKLVARVFFSGTPVSSPLSSVNGSANKIELK